MLREYPKATRVVSSIGLYVKGHPMLLSTLEIFEGVRADFDTGRRLKTS